MSFKMLDYADMLKHVLSYDVLAAVPEVRRLTLSSMGQLCLCFHWHLTDDPSTLHRSDMMHMKQNMQTSKDSDADHINIVPFLFFSLLGWVQSLLWQVNRSTW